MAVPIHVGDKKKKKKHRSWNCAIIVTKVLIYNNARKERCKAEKQMVILRISATHMWVKYKSFIEFNWVAHVGANETRVSSSNRTRANRIILHFKASDFKYCR
jgi:hypothetical protein